MKFDKFFYIQRNRDNLGIIPLDNFDNCRMRGTEKYPVNRIGEIDILEVDFDILHASPEPMNEITLRLIISQPYPCGLPTKGMSHYMQFLFYDFQKTIYLFLFDAKIVSVNDIPTNERRQRFSLTITSTKNSGEMAYRVFETKHEKT